MLRVAHFVLLLAYVILPLWGFLRARRRGRIDNSSLPMRRYIAIVGLGATIGATYCSAFGRLGGARPLVSEIFLAAYFATSLVLVFRVFDYLLSRILRVALVGAVMRKPRYAVMMLARAAILVAIIIPGVLVACVTYRPKIEARGDPNSQFGWQFEPVKVNSPDRSHLSAWWIPAQGAGQATGQNTGHPKATILLCPGIGDDKSSTLLLARELVPAGYNVLALDFYGAGDSPGHLAAFGASEQTDVLAALEWLRQNHPETHRVCGIGVTTGAAALVAAAASPAGGDIQAIALYDPYCDFDLLWQSATDDYLAQPFLWMAVHVGRPLLDLQTGQRLDAFHPGELATHLWPRPLLVLSSEHDPVVPFSETQRFFNTATQPKERYQSDSDLKKLLLDDGAAATVLQFFNKVRPQQII